MKKADDFKYQMKAKQQRLRELMKEEAVCCSPSSSLTPSSPSTIPAQSLIAWGNATPLTPPVNPSFPYSRHLNGLVSLHDGPVAHLSCDALVMPLSSCFREEGRDNGNSCWLVTDKVSTVAILCPPLQSYCSCCDPGEQRC